MKKLFCIIFLLFTYGMAFSQENLLDSLLLQIQEYRNEDSLKIDLYNEIAYSYTYINPNLGKAYADSAINLAKKLGLPSKEAEAINNLGVNYWSMGKDTLALDAFSHLLEIHRKTDNKRRLGITYNNMALIYYNRSDFRNALLYHENASEIFEALGLRKFLISSLSNSGVVFLALSDYPKALEYFLKASRITTEDDFPEKANIYSNIGLVHKNLNNLEEAEANQQNALKLFRQIGQKQGEASALSNLANIFQMKGNNEEALQYYQEALVINESLGNQRRIASDYSNLGIYYKGLENDKTAMEYFSAALEIYESIEDKLNASLVLLEIAEINKNTISGDRDNSKLNAVLDLQKRSLKLAEESESLLRQEAAWLAISKTFEELNQQGNALSAFRNHIIYKDSIFNEENQRNIMRQQIEFDFDKKEALLTAAYEMEKERLLAKAERDKLHFRIFLAAAIFLIIAGVILFSFYNKRKKAESARKEAEFKVRVANIELKALRSQMNPHFIFNSLSSISNFMLKNDAYKADHYLGKFSRLIRMILEFSDQKDITVSEEIEMLELYIQIESLRLDQELDYKIEADPELQTDNLLIPPLILQPFVENSIWHGISATDRKGLIEINISKADDQLRFTIRDNGAGRISSFKPANGEFSGSSKKSMGIKIIKDRISILNASQKQPSEINWRDLIQGLEVEIKLPYLTKF